MWASREPGFLNEMTGATLRMSREAIDWAFQDAPGVPAQCVSVLMALAHAADKRGCGAYLSAGTLATWTRKSKRQVHYDLLQLADMKLIRPGDQTLVARFPVNRRPVVYDLAMELTHAAGVQSTAPQVEVQSASPLQSTAPQTGPDQQRLAGVQSTAPQGGEVTGESGVQPIADKLNPLVVDVGDSGSVVGGSGGEDRKHRIKPRRPKRDLNAGRDDVERLCVHLAERVAANGYEDPKVTKDWLDAARLMLDADKRREDQVHKAIDWSQSNEFWRKNVRSMPKLREQYVRLQMDADDERKQLADRNGHGGADRRQQATDGLFERAAARLGARGAGE
jgi:hypothetical protein